MLTKDVLKTSRSSTLNGFISDLTSALAWCSAVCIPQGLCLGFWVLILPLIDSVICNQCSWVLVAMAGGQFLISRSIHVWYVTNIKYIFNYIIFNPSRVCQDIWHYKAMSMYFWVTWQRVAQAETNARPCSGCFHAVLVSLPLFLPSFSFASLLPSLPPFFHSSSSFNFFSYLFTFIFRFLFFFI